MKLDKRDFVGEAGMSGRFPDVTSFWGDWQIRIRFVTQSWKALTRDGSNASAYGLCESAVPVFGFHRIVSRSADEPID